MAGRAWRALQSAKTVEEATAAFVHFERPQGYTPGNPRNAHNFKGRLKFAKNLLGKGIKDIESQIDDNSGIDEFPEGTPLDTILRAQRAAQSSIAQRERIAQEEIKEQVAALTQQYNNQLDELKLAILDGNAGQPEIDAFREDNPQAGFKDVDSLQTELRQAEKRREDDTLSVDAFSDPDFVFDSTNSQHKKIIDTASKKIFENGNLTDDAVADTALSLVRRTNTVPKAVEGQVRALIDQRDPQLVRRGFDVLDRIYNNNPQVAIRDFPKKTLERLEKFKSLQGLISDEDLVKSVSRSPDLGTQQQRDMLAKEADKLTKDLTNEEILDDLDTSILPFTEPEGPVDSGVQSRLTLDYKNLFRESFVNTGDEETAKQFALDKIRTRWGTSSANQGRLMRFPPERHYPQVNGSHDWIGEQLKREIGPLVAVEELNPDNRIPNMSIVATRQTEADIAAGRPPRYKVLSQDENGLYNPIFNENGQEAFISFDPSEDIKKERKKFDKNRINNLIFQNRIREIQAGRLQPETFR